MFDQKGIDELFRQRNLGWDETKRYDYPLTSESIVWDIGTWHAEFVSNLRLKFDCYVHAFEILPRIQDDLVHWFESDSKVTVHRYGLGAKKERLFIRDTSECTSMYVTGITSVRVLQASEELTDPIDLMKINIEGAEYDLLNDLMDHDKINLIKYLQIQFHEYIQVDGIYIAVPNAIEQYEQVTQRLAETHTRQWKHDWVFESWARKESGD